MFAFIQQETFNLSYFFDETCFFEYSVLWFDKISSYGETTLF